MASERRVRLSGYGRHQAVRIARAFELPGQDAITRMERHRLIIEPTPRKSLLAVLAGLKPLGEKFAPITELKLDPVEL